MFCLESDISGDFVGDLVGDLPCMIDRDIVGYFVGGGDFAHNL